MKEITPAKYRCAFDASCPAIFEDPDGRHLWIIGERVDHVRAGNGEAAVRIDAGLLANVGGPVTKFFRRMGL